MFVGGGSQWSFRDRVKKLIKIDRKNSRRRKSSFKILTEGSKAPPRAVALASYLGDGYSALGARAPPAKDLMAFGSVLHHKQHNIGNQQKPKELDELQE